MARTRAKNEVIHSLSIVLNVKMVWLTAFSIAGENEEKKAAKQINGEESRQKKVTKNEITYLFMYFICTEKCELLHLATRTHMKLCVHLTHTIRLNVDQFFFHFHFTRLLYVFLFAFSTICVLCTISMYTFFPFVVAHFVYGVMIYVPFARFVLAIFRCCKISK